MKIICSFIVVLALVAAASCTKYGEEHPCFSENLVHDGPCTADCPGFLGCDGKTYCNECEAAREGIGPLAIGLELRLGAGAHTVYGGKSYFISSANSFAVRMSYFPFLRKDRLGNH